MTDGLSRLRLLYASFVSAIVAIGVVVLILDGVIEDSDTVPDAAAIGVIVLFGVVCLVAPPLVERPLDCTDDRSLVAGYTTRFFLRLAFGETPALVAFVVFVLTGRAWLYLVGLPFTAIGFLRAAPSGRNLDRDEEALVAAGCGRSLRAALGTVPPDHAGPV